MLADPRLEIYACGREDIRTGQIDRRVLALLEYLAERGFRLTVTSLKCGHSVLTTSGNVSHHSSGNAVDIAQINGLPVLGNQGPGSITEALVRDVMELQGTMRPAQIISLMDSAPTTPSRWAITTTTSTSATRRSTAPARATLAAVQRRSSSPTSGSA